MLIASLAWASDQEGTVDPAGPPDPAPVAGAETAPLDGAARRSPDLVLSLRVGWAIPRGSAFATADGSVPLRSEYVGLVTIHADAGLLLRRRFVVGGYAEVAHVVVNEHGGSPAEQVCHSAGVTSCSGVSVRLGLQGQVKLLEDRAVEPWVGAGAGYELLWYTADGKGEVIRSRKYGGLDLSAEAGVDFRVARAFGADLKIGPYASVSLGRYDTDRPASHQWVQLGLRGTLESPSHP